MQSNRFYSDNDAGTKGETIVMAWLLRQQGIKTILDVSDDNEFQKQDIDFIIQFTNNKICRVEVKTDYKAHETGNIPYEITGNRSLNSHGCLERTKADKIFFYIYNSNELLTADTKTLKQYVADNKDKLKEIPMGDTASGYLLSISELINKNIVKKFERIL